MNPKYESVYRVLLSFMMVDNNIDENEKKIIFEFLQTNFWQRISKESQSASYHKDKLNRAGFMEDLKIIYDSFSREELFEILDFISNLIKSDNIIDNKEIELFKIVLTEWHIEQSMLGTLWLKKSFLSDIFG